MTDIYLRLDWKGIIIQ